jgi:hypothetical protein
VPLDPAIIIPTIVNVNACKVVLRSNIPNFHVLNAITPISKYKTKTPATLNFSPETVAPPIDRGRPRRKSLRKSPANTHTTGSARLDAATAPLSCLFTRLMKQRSAQKTPLFPPFPYRPSAA